MSSCALELGARRHAPAEIAELAEGHCKFVAQPFVLIVQFAVGVPQRSYYRLVRLGGDSLLFGQSGSPRGGLLVGEVAQSGEQWRLGSVVEEGPGDPGRAATPAMVITPPSRSRVSRTAWTRSMQARRRCCAASARCAELSARIGSPLRFVAACPGVVRCWGQLVVLLVGDARDDVLDRVRQPLVDLGGS